MTDLDALHHMPTINLNTVFFLLSTLLNNWKWSVNVWDTSLNKKHPHDISKCVLKVHTNTFKYFWKYLKVAKYYECRRRLDILLLFRFTFSVVNSLVKFTISRKSLLSLKNCSELRMLRYENINLCRTTIEWDFLSKMTFRKTYHLTGNLYGNH